MSTNQFITLRANENQARGIGQYALEVLAGKHPGPSDAVLAKTEQFHLDSVACGVSALALGANACMIGRAALYGLGAGGEAGVARAISILRGELDTTMILAGVDDVKKIDHRVIASQLPGEFAKRN